MTESQKQVWGIIDTGDTARANVLCTLVSALALAKEAEEATVAAELRETILKLV